MKKTLLILILIFIVGGVAAWILLKKPTTNAPVPINQATSSASKKIMTQAKKILLIIAHQNFKDEEYFGTREALDKAKYQITVASDEPGTAQGVAGNEVKADLITNEVNVNNYNAVVFIGGPGALKHLDNPVSYGIAQKTIQADKLLAAICISPVVLAKAGVLEGKNATVWTSPLDKSPAKILEEHGAHYINQPVVQDGKIITGNGPSAAKAFGETIVKDLNSAPNSN